LKKNWYNSVTDKGGDIGIAILRFKYVSSTKTGYKIGKSK